MNKPNPKNRKSNKTIEDLIDFIESTAKSFTNSPTFKEQYHDGSDEDDLTGILLWHYQEENNPTTMFNFIKGCVTIKNLIAS